MIFKTIDKEEPVVLTIDVDNEGDAHVRANGEVLLYILKRGEILAATHGSQGIKILENMGFKVDRGAVKGLN